jgi:threonine synthase
VIIRKRISGEGERVANSYLRHFVCIGCGTKVLPQEVRYTCPRCQGNLDARYDYRGIGKTISPTFLEQQEYSIWRYRSFLPLESFEPPIPLKVGMTPLTRAPNLGRSWGLENLFIKNDGLNPSGSLKDRASYVVAARCLEENIRQVCTASSGNAGVSLACLGASARIETIIFAPETAPRPKVVQLLVYGARVFLVRGSYSQAFDLCEEVSSRLSLYNRNTGTNPYTREGKKTVSFEIWEQMGFRVPHWIFVSVGDGNIISGVYKGFFDLREAGLIDGIPRLVGVQSGGSAAITRAFEGDGVIRGVDAETVADSISVSRPSDGEAALTAVRETGGRMMAVEDEAILESVRSLAEHEGVFAELSGAACLAGLERMVNENAIQREETAVLLVTGNGLKDVESASTVSGAPTVVDTNVDEVVGALRT